MIDLMYANILNFLKVSLEDPVQIIYNRLNLRLSTLVVVYLGLFGLYISLPQSLTALRSLISTLMLVVLAVTVVAAIGYLAQPEKN